MGVIPEQCDPHAEQVLIEALRRMTPGERLARVDDLWESLRTIIHSRLLAAHPEWSEGRLASEVVRRMTHDAGSDPAVRHGAA